MRKCLTLPEKCATILPVSERMNNMKQYQVLDEDGLYRMFDVSHDGLEDAIEFAQKVNNDVTLGHPDPYEDDELVWSFEESGEHDAGEPWDGFNSDAEADGDALASAGFGTDEDYGCFDSGDEDYGCEY